MTGGDNLKYEIDESLLDEKNMLTMKLLHYFITEKDYNPVILQGVDNEIWLENLDEDYRIVRIVSGNILNEEQFRFDVFKTKRIVKKIKAKTLTLKINTLSIFLDIEESFTEKPSKDITCLKIKSETDIKKNKILKKFFPDISKKLKYSEEGLQLFMRITNDINKHNVKDNKKVEEVFRQKYPLVTYTLITINVLIYLIPFLFNEINFFLNKFCLYNPLIKNGEYYRILTGAFLHANIFHLLFNCYTLYVIGIQLESFLGKIKYLLVYLFSAITASLMSMIFLGNSVSVGASGAIFGLMGSLVYFGYYYRVYLGSIVKTQIIPLIITNLLLGLMITGIDNFAHIGGLIGGSLITIALGVKYKSSTFEKVNGYILSFIYLIFLIFMAFTYTM